MVEKFSLFWHFHVNYPHIMGKTTNETLQLLGSEGFVEQADLGKNHQVKNDYQRKVINERN